ncbi:MAG TPA: ATP-dependent sacrificial sulfur transferase LarE [Nitrospiria bacterium]|nr:ATP-dependent sacrificial sulfur transferase LarE [Nitrospiria bacterium]
MPAADPDASSAINMDTQTHQNLERLQDIFQKMDSVLVAFSGGIDSTLVLKIAHDVLGARAAAATSVSPTVPASELESSRQITRQIGVSHHLISSKAMEHPEFHQNGLRRCYACKHDLYSNGTRLAKELGLRWLANGTNLDDLKDFRPGLEAAEAFGVRSPLVEAGLDKIQIRHLSRAIGLPNWDKPAEACLSSRVPFGTVITVERLGRIERAEEALKREGFRQVRVRDHGEVARIELSAADLDRLLDATLRERVVAAVKETGFRFVTLDLQGYRQGGLNPEALP